MLNVQDLDSNQNFNAKDQCLKPDMQHEKYRYSPNKITNHGGFPWLIPHNWTTSSRDLMSHVG